jgi:hypothetical protein
MVNAAAVCERTVKGGRDNLEEHRGLRTDEGDSMYAALVKLTIDTLQAPAAAAAFSNDILPRVKATSGFVGGYWLDPAGGEGLGLVLFETAEQAAQVKPTRFSWSAPGVTILDVDIRRVAVAVP